MATRIPLVNSPLIAVADDEFAHLTRYRWKLDKKGYVVRATEVRDRVNNKIRRVVKLEHEIVGFPPAGQVVDHINRDRLDNRRENFRLITVAQNNQNKSHQRRNKVGIRGVTLRSDTGRFLASACVDRKLHRLGYFDTPEEAAAVVRAWRARHMPFSQEALDARG